MKQTQDTNTISLLFRVLAGMITILSMPMLIEYITESIQNDFVNINGIELITTISHIYLIYLLSYVAVKGRPPKHWENMFGNKRALKWW